MAETASTETTAGKKKSGKKWLIALVVIAVILIAFFVTMAIMHKRTMDKIKSLIQTQADQYANSAKVAQMITDACGEIISEGETRRMAKKLARDNNVSYEQAVVDMAVGQLRSMKYIA